MFQEAECPRLQRFEEQVPPGAAHEEDKQVVTVEQCVYPHEIPRWKGYAVVGTADGTRTMRIPCGCLV